MKRRNQNQKIWKEAVDGNHGGHTEIAMSKNVVSKVNNL